MEIARNDTSSVARAEEITPERGAWAATQHPEPRGLGLRGED